MLTGLLLSVLLATGGLCYPRRPRTAGLLFIILGILSAFLAFQSGAATASAAFIGMTWASLGLGWIVKYRNPDVRVKHVEYWTAKA
jgi:hypothetical protein